MILIVDDDVAMAETCSMFLELQGFEVNIATSGAEALSIINGLSHELLISDCAMPGMTGGELSEKLKADPSTAQLPILLMSASLRCDVAKSSSADGFLRKPFLAENLLHEVRKLLDGNCIPVANSIKA
jgi:two-component system chemotaxis response regulator CheY